MPLGWGWRGAEAARGSNELSPASLHPCWPGRGEPYTRGDKATAAFGCRSRVGVPGEQRCWGCGCAFSSPLHVHPRAYADAETIAVIIPTMVTVTVAEMPASSHRRLYFISSVFQSLFHFV